MAKHFHEYQFVRKDAEGDGLRFFFSDYFTLTLWSDEEGICQFQLCYDRDHDEHAVTWQREGDYMTHHSVDEGSTPGRHAQAAVLREASHRFQRATVERFAASPGAIPKEAHQFVTHRLLGFAAAE